MPNTRKSSVRKSVTTVKRHFNPRLLILHDRVNVALAMQGIDPSELENFQIAERIFGIPQISVHQSPSAEIMLEDLQNTIGSEFCKGITKDYVEYSFKKADMVLYIKNQQYPYDMFGFATMSIIGEDLFVDVICTNTNYMGAGRHFFDSLLPRIRDVLGLRQITLCSTRDAYSFYKHLGLEEVKNNYYCVPPLRKMRLRARKTVRASKGII